MGRVAFEIRPSPQSIPWAPEDEAQVTSIVRDCLRGADGAWKVALTFSGVLSHTWVVECRRQGDGRGLQLLLDPRLPHDVASFRTALTTLAAAQARRERSSGARRPGSRG